MSEKLPYEQELNQEWNDLPLPDENMAWADMKRRLDEDDDDGIIPFWLRGCLLWGFVGVLVIALGWWILRPEKWFASKTSNPEKTEVVQNKEKKIPAGIQEVQEKKMPKYKIQGTRMQENKTNSDENAIKNLSRRKKIRYQKNESVATAIEAPVVKKEGKKKGNPQNVAIVKKNDEVRIDQAPSAPVTTQNDGVVKKQDDTVVVLTANGNRTYKPFPADSVSKKATDTIQRKQAEKKTEDVAKKTQDSAKAKKHFSFAIGIAEQQQLPIAGQKLTPYSASGRKGSLSDYIPSLYVRLYRENRWFLQSEFKYGAPQYTKEFLYYQNIKVDTQAQKITTTSASLKKTFYHQLPVTFNYFVLPNWSVGGGFIWNKFSAAVASRSITERRSLNVDVVVDPGTIFSSKDSAGVDKSFAQSYFHAVFESQYKWKKLSFGARYAFGLQPYITFNLPGGIHKEETNRSLQLFIRYELWRSKRK